MSRVTRARRWLLGRSGIMVAAGLMAACGARERGPAPAVPPTPPPPTVAPPAASPTAPPATAVTGDRRLPLFDTHAHYSEDAWGPIPIDRALQLMDRAGTRLALVSSTPDTGTIRLYQAAPDRIIPILRPYRSRADMGVWHRDPSIIPYLAERLTLGLHRGIGEFHLYGDEAESSVVAEMARLAFDKGIILHAHADERAIRTLLRHQPEGQVLWAHAGFVGPEAVEAMLVQHPRLWVEFAFRSDIASNGRLDPAWEAVIVRHADRFMVGSDSYTVQRWTSMPAVLGAVREWCEALPPALGQQLAWGNAARLFAIDPARFATS